MNFLYIKHKSNLLIYIYAAIYKFDINVLCTILYQQFCINVKCDFKIRQQIDEFLQQYFSYIMAVSFIGGGNKYPEKNMPQVTGNNT